MLGVSAVGVGTSPTDVATGADAVFSGAATATALRVGAGVGNRGIPGTMDVNCCSDNGFIGGRVTSGAGAAGVVASYTDRTALPTAMAGGDVATVPSDGACAASPNDATGGSAPSSETPGGNFFLPRGIR
jgi:hypothetical protein